MRKFTIVVPDDKVALVEELVKAIPDMEIVEVKDVDSIEEFQRKPPMERLDFATSGSGYFVTLCSFDNREPDTCHPRQLPDARTKILGRS